jgi:hypothetical protein
MVRQSTLGSKNCGVDRIRFLVDRDVNAEPRFFLLRVLFLFRVRSLWFRGLSHRAATTKSHERTRKESTKQINTRIARLR